MKIIVLGDHSPELVQAMMAQLDATNSGIELFTVPKEVDYVLTAAHVEMPELKIGHFVEKPPRRGGQKNKRGQVYNTPLTTRRNSHFK